jgi:predicted RNA methylase
MIPDFFQADSSPSRSKTDCLFAAADSILGMLSGRQQIAPRALQDIMSRVFGGTDATGAWQWKDAYEALEIALARYLHKYGDTMRRLRPSIVLTLLDNLQTLCPTHTKRSEESQAMQQFSTPVGIGFVAAIAVRLSAGDTVLEPSAGTGLLAVMARMHGAGLILNELAPERRSILARLFPQAPLSAHNAEYLSDYLDASLAPSVVLMNPPFSASPNARAACADVTSRHILSALRLLPEGGRLVAISGDGFSPYAGKWRSWFVSLQKEASVRFSAGISGRLYAKHGTTIPTRLTVIDRVPAENPEIFANYYETAETLPALLDLVQQYVPARACAAAPSMSEIVSAATLPAATAGGREARRVVELEYAVKEWLGGGAVIGEGLYEAYELQAIDIPGAHPHPSPLVQSAAMASIAGPKPSYRPHLYQNLVSGGVLSDAQLESLIYAGEAHSQFLKGHFLVDPVSGAVTRVAADAEGAVRFRKGWYLGDGTGCGKGRQVAGILLDNWLKGRRRAVWLSKNDKLLEDAVRDWTALGGREGEIIPQWRFKLGDDIGVSEGILFTTYSTLRMPGRQGRASRLQQLTAWLGRAFDGCIVFDEAHAMANAVAGKGSRGKTKPSAQGLAGIQLQNLLPDARIVYVSATGATTVSNLAYATRLGLWGTDDMPFDTQSNFVSEMERGGIAAMEMISRDLKALGLYSARSLSYAGVQYEFLEHTLTAEQIRIYDAYAEAFHVIHHNLEAALTAVNINREDGRARNGMAKAAIRSAFEGNKQRFFNHLLVAMKCPSLLRAMQRDLDAGLACVVQIVSTGEALMERRLAEIPACEWNDLHVDITPREYVLDYLHHAFPVHLHEVFTDEEGNETTRPALDAGGNPVLSRVAVAKRDALIETLASLPAVPSALDQIVQHFGHQAVAEVTGRSRRIVRVHDGGCDRLCVQNRPASANIAETHAFMNDEKRILVFSEAGGTGRSYHADRSAANRRLRRHYLLEAGWKADSAIQGLGRTNRTNQEQPPVFIPVASNVKGEKRFLSTIARRLDTLGAITRGQRQTGGQGLFREEDNLESAYARAALRELFLAITGGKVACCSLEQFTDATGLELLNDDGGIREDLPPIHQFLNRLLALPIALQNALFEAFEARLVSRIEQAREAGAYEAGVETLQAEGFTVLDRQALYVHPATGSETICSKIERRDRTRILPLPEALAIARKEKGQLVVNASSGRVAVATAANAFFDEQGAVHDRIQLLRPQSRSKIARSDFADSGWRAVDEAAFSQLWQEEADAAPLFTTSSFYLITGILLPVWSRLPAENMRVWCLQADDGQKLLGRVVHPDQLAAVLERFGLSAAAPALSPQEILDTVIKRGKPCQLQNGLQIRLSTVMGQPRIEITGFRETQREMLKALGCIVEIISWKARLFVPVNDNAPAIIGRLREVA